MNNKGFTLIELLTTLLILGVIVSLSVVTVRYNTENTMKKSEEVFIDTLRDSISMYINSDKGNFKEEVLEYIDASGNKKTCKINKELGKATLYEVKSKDENGSNISFESVINSDYKPILEEEMVNPADKELDCNITTTIRIFRDSDYVYYYSFNGDELECLIYNKGDISNLPSLPEGCIK